MGRMFGETEFSESKKKNENMNLLTLKPKKRERRIQEKGQQTLEENGLFSRKDLFSCLTFFISKTFLSVCYV